MDSSKKILFLIPYPVKSAPSQRYRFEQYFELLKAEGFVLKISPFFNKRIWDILYQKGGWLEKVKGTLEGYFKRFILLWKVREFNWIFIHREALPFGPPVYEWILTKLLKQKIVYDFDDAIWISQPSTNNKMAGKIKSTKNVERICTLSHRVSAGNQFLANFANKFNSNVMVVPTTIDMQYHNKIKTHLKRKEVVIGWTGTQSTLPYLQLLISPLKKLVKRYPVKILIIANQTSNLSLDNVIFKQWSIDTEIEDLMQLDIGLMPLPDTEWARGKCGLKALQYMALGIPAVVSPVGVNKSIVEHGVHGFHCQSETDWLKYLEQLVLDPQLRTRMGELGRSKVQGRYSVNANKSNFLSLFA